MSEEIDLEANNLCAPEDAFEKFTSISMSNEDEFITLSDIVSPTYQEPDRSSDLRDIPYDNEVVLSSNSELDQQDVNTTLKCETKTDQHEDTKSKSAVVYESDEKSTTNCTNKSEVKLPSTKRIRKKNNYYKDDEFIPFSNTTRNSRRYRNKALVETNSETEQPDSSSSTKNKRSKGKQKKTIVATNLEQPSINTSLPGNSDASISSFTSDRENVIMLKKCEAPEKKRPGRPKKLKLESNISEPDSTIDINVLNETGLQNNTCTEHVDEPKIQLRRRKYKNTEDTSDVESNEPDVTTLENVFDTMRTNTDLQDILEGKKSRGSGKKKKTISKPTTTVLEEKSLTLNNIKSNEIENSNDAIFKQLHEIFSEKKTNTLTESIVPESPTNIDKPDLPLISLKNEAENLPILEKEENKKKNVIIKETNVDSLQCSDECSQESDGEEVCLSKLKETIKLSSSQDVELNVATNLNTEKAQEEEMLPQSIDPNNSLTESVSKRNSKMPIMDDFEYNLDRIVDNTNSKEDTNETESLLIEDTNKRSVRRRKQMHYEVDSDEDPFANVEISDDDEPRRNKKGKYNSDDEYIPEIPTKGRKKTYSESGSEEIYLDDIERSPKKRRIIRKSDGSTFKKRTKKNNMHKLISEKGDTVKEFEVPLTIGSDHDTDIEECLQPPVTELKENQLSSKWGTTVEFENFLAKKIGNTNIKIRKCTNKQNNSITPLEIPVIDQNKPKKFIDEYSQTNVTKTYSVASQTNTIYEIPMEDNVALTSEQSEKACEFLSSVVTTTAELGKLMTQKSEDFMKKKINTTHVTDTMKMDYCVKKSFLLFKLAKHNLEQMEEDLAKQYEEFLQSNDLSKCRAKPKILTPNLKYSNDDSDCEIVEVPVTKTQKKSEKPSFNPKRVFLNKELSIKIAKKPTDTDKKLEIKGRHEVWISDSVMVKKVKPTQSFLAQDSRNKKPPDHFITAKMLSDFFKNYYHQEAIKLCAPFTSIDWLTSNKSYVCNYFVVKDEFKPVAPSEAYINENELSVHTSQSSSVTSQSSPVSFIKPVIKIDKLSMPDSLFTLCLRKLQNYLFYHNNNIVSHCTYSSLETKMNRHKPVSLFRLCICALNTSELSMARESSSNKPLETKMNRHEPLSLFQLCIHTLNINHQSVTKEFNSKKLLKMETNRHEPLSLFQLCIHTLNTKQLYVTKEVNSKKNLNTETNRHEPLSLFQSCTHTLNTNQQPVTKEFNSKKLLKMETKKHEPLSLFQLCIHTLNTRQLSVTKEVNSKKLLKMETNRYEPLSWFQSCTHTLNTNQQPVTKEFNSKKLLKMETKRHEPLSLFQLCIHTLNTKQIPVTKLVNLKKNLNTVTNRHEPLSLFQLCIHTLNRNQLSMTREYSSKQYLSDSQSSACSVVSCYSSINLNENLEEFPDNDKKYEPFTLFHFSMKVLQNQQCHTPKSYAACSNDMEVSCMSPVSSPLHTTLNALCYNNNINLCFKGKVCNELSLEKNHNTNADDSLDSFTEELLLDDEGSVFSMHKSLQPKSLLSLCIENIQYLQSTLPSFKNCKNVKLFFPNSLKCITLNNIKNIIFGHTSNLNEPNPINGLHRENITIDCVNTLSEEAFHSLDHTSLNILNTEYTDMDCEDSNVFDDDEYHEDYENDEQQNCIEDNEGNWLAQVKLQEPRSCVISSGEIVKQSENISMCTVTQIKVEQIEEVTESVVDTSIIKSEPLHNLDEMTVIPESIITKSEEIVNNSYKEVDRRDSTSVDFDTFESFVQRNKMMQSINDPCNEEIFTQSLFRVRRQFEPDYEDDNELNNSLLVPQNFEPMLGKAKDSLMQSSSDEVSGNKKVAGKKRVEKRKKKEIKKPETKPTTSKDAAPIIKVKPPPVSEISVLTRRMRERIRQEEKKIDSSDSEPENVSVSTRKDKKNDKHTKTKEIPLLKTKTVNDEMHCNAVEDKNEKNSNAKEIPLPKTPIVDNEIQCNAVDSTEQVNENIENQDTNHNHQNTGPLTSSAYNASLVTDNVANDHFLASMLNFNEPAEILECEPMMPIFGDFDEERRTRRSVGHKSTRTENNVPELKKINRTEPSKESINVNADINKQCADINKQVPDTVEKINYIDRDGWNCYQIDSNDQKLYQQTCIPLDKLPESFVETYFHYQVVTDKTKEDHEVDRLTNLSSLARSSVGKDVNPKTKYKIQKNGKESAKCTDEIEDSRPPSPTNSEQCLELTPSEDEGVNNVGDMIPPEIPCMKQTENNFAKNSLMNDNDSDTETLTKVKEELQEVNYIKRRPGPKSKTEIPMTPKTENLMLTADKMMNKELSLLNSPVILNTEVPVTPSTNVVTRSKKKNALKTEKAIKEQLKAEEDSSSEEEKQWVSTKEKLLKRMGKKEDAIVDDAKRAKLVSEFIERRSDMPELRKRRPIVKTRRSKKKLLERQKQLRVLSSELLGEPVETPAGGRTYAQMYAKGRRNIRKVIDKKSLTRSTVLANMEELERKRRLSAKQNKLRELLGCEEGVNVFVINDEVCLEYDFVEEQPVVTIHPFFTKVMKTHQYEGVKFMWDACFESLEMIESGHPGGGCILAHCMGLGKTLQVLALLHTVLTHPRVGMRRVLVCCPLSTVLNWVDEIHKWIGPVTNEIKVFELSKLRKTYERAYQLEDWYNGGGIFIIGYELFRSLSTLDPELDDIRPTIINKIRTALLDPGPDIIVCDEGHLLKNDCSVLAVAMSRVVTKRRIVLTGTPMQNNLREYYCMVNFVKPNLLGTYSEYSNRFENPIMNGQHRDSSEDDIKLMKARTHILHKVLEGCLQRQEASVLYPYLPKKHEYTVFIPLTKCQWDLYKYYIHKYGKTSKQSTLKDFHILQKIWSHPLVLHNFQIKNQSEKDRIKLEKLEDDLAREDLVSEDVKSTDTEVWWMQYLDGGNLLNLLDSSNKFVAVFRILDECNALGDKVLIFSTSLFSLDGLEYFLKERNNWSLGKEYYRLDGSVPPEVRQKWCREFNAVNNQTTKLFLISTRAGCLGLNMTAANRVIILDTSWNPAHDIQSIFRVYRFGQKKDCFIYRLVALGTMEQKIYERSVTKQAVACRVVDEQQIDRHYNMADLTELYRFDEQGVSVACGVAVGVEDVALLRVARDSAVHAVHEHDSLLRGSSEQNLPEHERHAAWMQFQQEHAHKQMQNEIQMRKENEQSQNIPQEKVKKGKKNKVAKLEIELPVDKAAQISDQKIDSTPALSNTIESESTADRDITNAVINVENVIENEPEVESEDNSKDDADYVPEYHYRKNKPPNTPAVVVQENADPSESMQQTRTKANTTEKYSEDTLIQAITVLLKEYNFRPDSEPHVIMNLINNVKHLVFGGGYTTDEPLSQHIASLIIQCRCQSVPALTHFICEAINRNLNESAALSIVSIENKKRGRPRRYKEVSDNRVEDSPSTSKVTPIIEITVTKNDVTQYGRTRSQRAKSAEKVPNTPPSEEVINIDEAEPNPVVVPTDVTPKPNVIRTEVSAPVVEDSIVLSDDDDDDMPLQPAPKPQPVQKKPIPKKSSNIEKPKHEVIPLHPTLLTNKNFIKIVAHTYLEGDKMLDEEAAVLAAEYSTFKTLEEYEATGKNIESGPIYDIALKVLGKDFLKKVNQSKSKHKQSAEQTTPVKKDNTTIAPQVQTSKEPETRRTRQKPSSTEKQPARAETRKSALAPAPATPTPPPPPPVTCHDNVVPVGLFKTNIMPTPSFPQPSHSECILPDDDDVQIITDEPTPPIVPSQNCPMAVSDNIGAVPVGLIHRNSQPLNMNSVTNGQNGGTWRIVPLDLPVPLNLPNTLQEVPLQVPGNITGQAPQAMMPPRHVIKISSGKIVGNTALYDPRMSSHVVDTTTNVTSTIAIAPKPVPNNVSKNISEATSSSTVSICLDSDEEESITPNLKGTQPQEPVTPILSSLRAIGPDGQMIPVITPQSQAMTLNSPTIQEMNKVNTKQNPSQASASSHTKVPSQTINVGNNKSNVKTRQSILRITNSGELVLKDLKSTNDDTTHKNITNPQSASTSLKRLAEKPTAKKPIRNYSSSSFESRSPSASPTTEDPLSILKDVIHIQAVDNPSSSTSSNSKTSNKRPENKLTGSRVLDKTNNSISNKSQVKSSVKKPPQSTPNNTISTSRNTANTSKNSIIISKNTPSTSKTTTTKKISSNTNKNSSLSQAKSAAEKSNEILKKFNQSIDKGTMERTTNKRPSKVPETNVTKATKSSTLNNASGPKTQENKSSGPITVIGTSKNLIFSGKSITTKNNETSKPSNVVNSSKAIEYKPLTLKFPTSSLVAKMDKKRPSLSEPGSSAPKKKKFGAPLMTLKDFNLDDIDDVIELE